jgi:hypothetical protein
MIDVKFVSHHRKAKNPPVPVSLDNTRTRHHVDLGGMTLKIGAMSGTRHNGARLAFLILASRSQRPPLRAECYDSGRGN